jgi:lipoprotein-releasing system permease protein
MKNLELFIARRIQFDSDENDKKVSRPAVRIATIGIALGLAVMIIAVSVVVGFKTEIRNKVIGFGSHIQITNLDTNTSYETAPISVDDEILTSLLNLSEVRHVQRFATKPGIIKTDDQFEGVVLKGVDSGFDWTFFKNNLTEGRILEFSDTINNGAIISKSLADRLLLRLGDEFVTYFIQERVRARKFTITGIYDTGLNEYDRLFVLADIRHVQRLNTWEEDEVTGIEILINDYRLLDKAEEQVFVLVGNRFDKNGSAFYIQTIKDINPQIFGWLDLLDMNVWVILLLMIAVAGFNMISGLLIIILEKTNLIGILKALGAKDWSVRKVFLYQSFFLVGKGMIIGNIIGVSLCLLQHFTGIIKLNEQYYYLSEVPVYLNIYLLLLLNVATFTVSMLMLVGPSYLISKISPAKSIRFE